MLNRGDDEVEPRAEIAEVRSEVPGANGSAADGHSLGPVGPRSGRAVAAAAGFLVVLGVVALIGFLNRVNPTGPTGPTGPTPAAPSPVVGVDGFPARAAGLPVVSVSAAEAVAADPSTSTDEVAIGGWYSAVRLVESCRPSLQPVGECVSDWQAVVESRPDTRWSSDGASHPIVPGTSAVTPYFINPMAPPQIVSANAGGPLEIVAPTQMVLIGHFHDDRLCSGTSRVAVDCSTAFVVDGLADLSGASGPIALPNDAQSTELTSAGIVNVIRSRISPDAFVLGYGALPWEIDLSEPPYVEPSPDGPPVDGRTVWLVRGYLEEAGGATPASWMGIDDQTGQAWGPMALPGVVDPLAAEFPRMVDGLPVQTVSAALTQGPEQGRVLAIGGYLSSDRAVEGCPPKPTTDKPDSCSGTQLVLIDRPGSVLEPNDATFLYEIAVPTGLASIRPVIPEGTSVADPWGSATGIDARLAARPVVLVGQFGDPRSPECSPRPGGGNAGCDRSFVVDQLAWLDGLAQDPSEYVAAGVAPSHTVKEVGSAVAGWFLSQSQPAIVSVTSTLPADSAGLTGVALDGRAAQLFWVVRVISDLPEGPASTQLVFDDRTLNLVEVTAGG